MLADSNATESHLRAELPAPCLSARSSRTHGEAWQSWELPVPPAMPGAVLVLELLLGSNVADLDAITRLIRTDVGLTVQLLRFAFGQPSKHRPSQLNLAELIVHLGLEPLRAMAAGTRLLSCQASGHAAFRACKAFWVRACRVAHTAEELTAGSCSTIRETAYIAGLLCHIGSLPALLDWRIPGLESANPREIGCAMAKAWHFPSILVEIIRRDEQACTCFEARRLLRLINAADRQISAIDFSRELVRG